VFGTTYPRSISTIVDDSNRDDSMRAKLGSARQSDDPFGSRVDIEPAISDESEERDSEFFGQLDRER
jgi:hypothetical protein